MRINLSIRALSGASRVAAVGALCGVLGLPAVVAAQGFVSPVQNKGAEIVLQAGFEPEACTPIYPTGTLGDFAATFGTPWPAYNDRLRLFMNGGTYSSLLFVANTGPQFGTVTSTGYPGDGDGLGQISISRVAGCFDPAFLEPGCLSEVSVFPSLNWHQTPGNIGCYLAPGEVYYVNYTFGLSAPSGSGPHCPTGTCGRDTGNIQQ